MSIEYTEIVIVRKKRNDPIRTSVTKSIFEYIVFILKYFTNFKIDVPMPTYSNIYLTCSRKKKKKRKEILLGVFDESIESKLYLKTVLCYK